MQRGPRRSSAWRCRAARNRRPAAPLPLPDARSSPHSRIGPGRERPQPGCSARTPRRGRTRPAGNASMSRGRDARPRRDPRAARRSRPCSEARARGRDRLPAAREHARRAASPRRTHRADGTRSPRRARPRRRASRRRPGAPGSRLRARSRSPAPTATTRGRDPPYDTKRAHERYRRRCSRQRRTSVALLRAGPPSGGGTLRRSAHSRTRSHCPPVKWSHVHDRNVPHDTSTPNVRRDRLTGCLASRPRVAPVDPRRSTRCTHGTASRASWSPSPRLPSLPAAAKPSRPARWTQVPSLAVRRAPERYYPAGRLRDGRIVHCYGENRSSWRSAQRRTGRRAHSSARRPHPHPLHGRTPRWQHASRAHNGPRPRALWFRPSYRRYDRVRPLRAPGRLRANACRFGTSTTRQTPCWSGCRRVNDSRNDTVGFLTTHLSTYAVAN